MSQLILEALGDKSGSQQAYLSAMTALGADVRLGRVLLVWCRMVGALAPNGAVLFGPEGGFRGQDPDTLWPSLLVRRVEANLDTDTVATVAIGAELLADDTVWRDEGAAPGCGSVDRSRWGIGRKAGAPLRFSWPVRGWPV